MNINPTMKTATNVTDRVPPSLLYRNIARRDAYETNMRRIALQKSPIPSQSSAEMRHGAYAQEMQGNYVTNTQRLPYIILHYNFVL